MFFVLFTCPWNQHDSNPESPEQLRPKQPKYWRLKPPFRWSQVTQPPVHFPSLSPAVAAALTERLILLWWNAVTPSSPWWMRFIIWHKRARAPPSSWQLYHPANVPKCHLLYARWPSNFLIQFHDPLSSAQPKSWTSNNNYTPRRLQNLQFPL